MEIEISRLNLLSPLFCARVEGLSPFDYREGEGEKLFCFELDEAQYLNFEPEKEKFFARLIFAGTIADRKEAGENPGNLRRLPVGNYLFAQKREILTREDTEAMALEIQLEGLWQRLKPGKELYLRYLFEDGRGVTQLFRPYED
jgi:hypothetical protein